MSEPSEEELAELARTHPWLEPEDLPSVWRMRRDVDEAKATGEWDAEDDDDGPLFFESLLEQGRFDVVSELLGGEVVDPSEDRPTIDDRITGVSAALVKLPPYLGTVFRGGEISPENLAAYEPGRFVTELAFTSTTKESDWDFPRGVAFIVNSFAGKDVSHFSQDPELGEVMFEHGTEFLVLDRSTDPDSGVAEVWLTEVGSTQPSGHDLLVRMRGVVDEAKASGRWRTRPLSPERAERFEDPIGVDNSGRVTSFADVGEMRRALGTGRG